MLPTYRVPSGPQGQYRPQHCHMARAFIGSVTGVPDDDAILSELEPTSKQICLLEEFELAVAKQMRTSGDVDEVSLETKASRCNGDILSILGSIHRLRLQYNRAQDNLQAKLEICPSLPGSPYRVDGSRFYAVLIGIDEYASYPLHGCVSDVRLIEKYLTEDLGVPRNRIQLLLGSKEHTSPADPMNPSRAHIIGALLNIINNPEILYGDNIIIFYSGHGSCYPFEGKGDAIEHIEALCPIDRDTIGGDGKRVPDISDREFNAILTRISQVKGHCITVILDCCYSGSVSRGAGARTASRTRCTTVQDMLLAGEQIFGGYPDYRSILSKDWYPDMDSHVVLAACKAHQLAMSKAVEGEGAEEHIGIFTDSLVQALRSGYCTRETTYTDLVRFLDRTPHQTPVVAGKRKGARIWYQE
ncbi:uncharacterized protein ARMOST_02845 [Armillaria ostoyae]|uniref:Peptidase C14 caspase domain-containing protein n=1 Tax=Armillaria ostoyae TaxID=47428 RepID=A0A284QSU5_ARMOS|nr:uncharacterized protein ARMOST_02845 [Armillaria ostoyae]